jgi:hypothetical protein
MCEGILKERILYVLKKLFIFQKELPMIKRIKEN